MKFEMSKSVCLRVDRAEVSQSGVRSERSEHEVADDFAQKTSQILFNQLSFPFVVVIHVSAVL